MLVNDEIMTVQDVSKYLKLKPQTIYKWAREGQIPAAKFGKEWRFRRSLIDKWLDAQFTESPAVKELME
ncbi:helix-turn-helix domain-containing protein [bacterium]|nr:helix-turn-helix domain-containing protein [bacterium]